MQVFLPDEIVIYDRYLISDDIQVLTISSADILTVLKYLKNSPEYAFDMLKTVSCSQSNNSFEIIYLLFSSTLKHYFAINVVLSNENVQIDSVSSLYPSSNWDEREIYDLFGIKFINHPDLKRILLPEAWIGHPLRKDYVNNDDRLRWNCER